MNTTQINVGDRVKFPYLKNNEGIVTGEGVVLPSSGRLVRVEFEKGLIMWVNRTDVERLPDDPRMGMTRLYALTIMSGCEQGGLEGRLERLPSGGWVLAIDRPSGGTSRKYTVDGLWVCDEVEDCPGSSDVYHQHNDDPSDPLVNLVILERP